jgi:phospholipase/carboxylesterase
MHQKEIIIAGKKIAAAKKALIMVHGRGASAQDIMSLSSYFQVDDYALIAPQATNYTWYPFSFLAPREQNEPWLSSALSVLGEIVKDINDAGIPDDHIYFLGFSQGACLTLEYTARNAKKWGGIAAFTGGLIGDELQVENYKGDFNGTPVFIGTSDPDPHVPVDRVRETVDVLNNMNASVTKMIYQNMGHTINEDEIEKANELIFGDGDK